MKDVLQIRGLNKCYKDFKLDNIDLSLQKNCITGFIGVNGAGKTTTTIHIRGRIGNTFNYPCLEKYTTITLKGILEPREEYINLKGGLVLLRKIHGHGFLLELVHVS